MTMKADALRDSHDENGHGTSHGNPELPVCLHCKNTFHPSNGSITEDAAICDVCLDD